MSNITLELKNISKSFGGVKALKNIDLKVKDGEVLAIVGENGAGKSTLMKIIAGALQPNEGSILYRGETVTFNTPLEAMNKGISIVYQEPNIFGDMSVLENLFIGSEVIDKSGTIDWDKMYKEAVEALRLVKLSEEIISKRMNELSIGTQQLVLIARGIFKKCKILILDEPTSILSHAETETLFSIIEDLREKGVSILYISHRLKEIIEISDNIVVLRDGQITENLKPEEASEDRIITAMSGREVNMDTYRDRDLSEAPVLIDVKNLSSLNYFKDVSFSIKRGQILGMYGLVGSGRSEVARTIFGDLKKDNGDIYFEGQKIDIRNPKEAVSKKIFYVPEDRGVQGLFGLHSVQYNMSASFIDIFCNKLSVIDKNKEENTIENNIDKYSIKTKNMKSKITSLSGGSQQKVLFCRWLLEEPKLLILDEPTRGIDVKTKAEIHNYIMDLAANGVSVLLISSDLPEVLMLSDVVATMREGKITGCINREDLSEELVLKLSVGLND